MPRAPCKSARHPCSAHPASLALMGPVGARPAARLPCPPPNNLSFPAHQICQQEIKHPYQNIPALTCHPRPFLLVAREAYQQTSLAAALQLPDPLS